MKKKYYILLLSIALIIGCHPYKSKEYQYYGQFLDFSDDSSYAIIYVFVSQSCQSCNTSFYKKLLDKTLNENEYCLVLSHYPYCESERDITIALQHKFGNKFAIDSTDLHLKYKEIPRQSEKIVLHKTR
jgi:hypothetical protein